MLLDEGAVTTGGVSKVLTVLPMGGTVATGSVCILDTVLTIGGTTTVGKTCVRIPASTGCIPAGTIFLTGVFPSPVCSEGCAGAMGCAAIPIAVCWGCITAPGVDTETIFWAGTEECKAGVPAAGERVAGTVMIWLARGPDDGLGKREKEDRGAANLGKVGATAGALVDEHSACTGVAAANLIVASAEPRTGALVTTGETSAGILTNLVEDETKVDAPTAGDAKLPACTAGNVGRADTTFVLLCNNADPRLLSRTGMTPGVFEGNDGPTLGVHATKGELAAGTPGSLAGDCGKTGA